MPEIVLTAEERCHIAGIVEELDGAVDDFFSGCRDGLSDAHWTLLKEYATACIRQVLEVGMRLQAVAESCEGTCGSPHAARGSRAFVRAGLAAWRDSYSPIPAPWRLVEVFETVEGGERRILADITTLEAMASNRLLSSLDDEATALFARGG